MPTFHHIGLVTETEKPGECWFDKLSCWGASPDDDPNKVEWVRFTPESPLADTPVAKMPHISYLVDDLEAELEDKDVVVEPVVAADGVRIAYFMKDGGLVEYLEVKA